MLSSGIEEALRATLLEDKAKEIFACTFDYDQDGRAIAVKRAVTFTEKTRDSLNKSVDCSMIR